MSWDDTCCSISEATIVATWHVACDNLFPSLRRKCLQWLTVHFDWVVTRPLLLQSIDADSFGDLLANDELPVGDELQRFKAIDLWQREQKRRANAEEFKQLMTNIDWTLISEQELFNIACDEDRREYRCVRFWSSNSNFIPNYNNASYKMVQYKLAF